MTLESWKSLFENGSAWLGVAAAGSLVVALVLSNKVNKQQEEENRKQAKEYDIRFEEQKERTAKAEKNAADAQQETERLKALVSWREISADNRQKFVDATKNLPKGHVIVRSLAGNPEAVSFGLRLTELLKQSGYDVESDPGRFMPVGIPPEGVQIGLRDFAAQPAFAGPLHEALKSIGIDSAGQKDESAGDGVSLAIYSKPYSLAPGK